jgi:peptidoglycan/LPS O-acetylase OafA/YrhL
MALSSTILVIFMTTVLGFIFCIVVSHKWPSPIYYLLPTRTWEMMTGGSTFIYPLCIQDINKSFLLGQD